MIGQEVVMFGLALGAIILVSLIAGYSFATRDCFNSIRNVDMWIESTNSNQWVASYMYRELEEKYEKLLSEYEQYRGMIKVLKDCNGDKNE